MYVRPSLVSALVMASMPALAFAQTPLTFRAAVERALAANPAIAAARLRRPIAIASRDVAAERLNPEVQFAAARDTPHEIYTVAVPWELGGKRARRVDAATAAIATGEAELNQTIAQVQADVRRAYFARFAAERRFALLGQVQALAQRAVDAAQARFDEGDSPRLEVVQTRLARAEAENQAVAAGGAVAATRIELNALLGYPLDALTPIDAAMEVDRAAPLETTLARAREANTELKVIDRRIDEARARLALAHAVRTPDVVPQASLSRRAAPEFDTGWGAGLSISIPVFTSHLAGVRVEEATLTQLQTEREATLARVQGEVMAAASVADAHRQQYVRYRDEIGPQALEMERMAEDSYRLGQTPVAAYLLSLMAARDIRLREIQAAADFQNALADLERAVGALVTP